MIPVMLERAMKQFVFAIMITIAAVLLGNAQAASALTSHPKTSIAGDNTFFAYVIAGEKVTIDFTKINLPEPTPIPREAIEVAVEAPGMDKKVCSIPATVADGGGCSFDALTAPKTGIWKISFRLPSTAHVHGDVASSVHWGSNDFSWKIDIKDSVGEKKGRVWSELYAIRQPAPVSFLADLTFYYESEDGYLYRAIYRGYNGQLSTLSADAFGIIKNGTCIAAYESVQANNTEMKPSFGGCGGSYKLFFEQPSDDLPEEAAQWDGATSWVRPKIDRPVVDGLKFAPSDATDVQSGTISYTLKNFIGQYEVKIDTNADGNYDSRDDITLKRQVRNLKSAGEQKISFDGVNGSGVGIPKSQHIKIKINISKAAEIHLVGADIESRQGGIELTRLSGDNAPNSQVCWNDTELGSSAEAVSAKLILDGRDCPNSTGGVHAWKYGDSDGGTWGNARYIDDWAYASARVQGTAEIEYPNRDEEAQAAAKRSVNIWLILGVIVLIAGGSAGFVWWKKEREKRRRIQSLAEQAPHDDSYPGSPRPPQV